jgi:hypothetical protein
VWLEHCLSEVAEVHAKNISPERDSEGGFVGGVYALDSHFCVFLTRDHAKCIGRVTADIQELDRDCSSL